MIQTGTTVKATLTGEKKQKYLLGLLALVFFILIYLLNIIYPLWGDDWKYSYIHTETYQPINGFSDIIVSQYDHYYTWGGRSVVHVIAQLLLWMGTTGAHLLNSLVYILFVFVVYKYANKGRTTDVRLFLFVNFLIFIAQLSFTNTAIWITGSANYLWGTLIIIAFMYPYYSYYMDRKSTDNFVKCLLFFLGGIVAGWTNENTSLAMISIMLLFSLCYWIIKVKIPKWSLSGIIGACIGCFLMIQAPGNFVRNEYITGVLGLADMSLIESFIFKAPKFALIYLTSMFVPVICFFILYRFFLRKERRKEQIQFSVLLLIGAHIGFCAMIVAPVFPLRATFGIVTFLIISVCILYANSDIKWGSIKIINNSSLVFILGVLFVFTYCRRYYFINYFSKAVSYRESFMDEQKAKGISDIVFETKIVLPKDFAFVDISDNNKDWINKVFSHYYGVGTARIKSQSQGENIDSQ